MRVLVVFAVVAFVSLASVGALRASDKQSYLLRTANALETWRADVPAMREPADKTAGKLADGGALYVVGPREIEYELCSRAGGIMLIRPLKEHKIKPNDVVLDFSDLGEKPSRSLPDLGVMIIRFGRLADGEAGFDVLRRAESSAISPTLAAAAYGWIFTGELIGALTRIGKMPVVYETIGGYGGFARISKYKNGEIAFHDKSDVLPVPAGTLGNRYIDAISSMLRRVEKDERCDLDRIGIWSREAKSKKKGLYMYSTGHMFPSEVENTRIGQVFRSGVLDAAFIGHKEPTDALHEADVVVHIGYQRPPDIFLRRARPAGAQVAYVTLHADRDFVNDKSVIWIDPMWDWMDGCVSLEGYDIPMLPASGVVNAAIAWEIYRLTVR